MGRSAGRPRLYSSDAEKQSAYRSRLALETVVVDRRALDNLHRSLERLQRAVWDAAECGDPLAKSCVGNSTLTVVHKLTTAFEKQAKDMPAKLPCETKPTRGGKKQKSMQEKQCKTFN